MIKFFRKIRQNLLTENKFSPPARGSRAGKYLLYAVGEIILVVIGILIALKINNWNESKQNENLEIAYLKGIKTNLIDDINELEKHFVSDTSNFDTYTFLIRAFNSDNIESKSQETISNLNSSSRLHWFEGQDIVFEDMKSSGGLNLIQSDTVKYAIQEYYKFFQEVVKQENQYISEIRKHADRNAQYLNVSSFLEPRFPERWNGNTGPPNLSLINESDFDQIKPKLIDNLSNIKSYKYLSHKVRLDLYQKGNSLHKIIEQYLEEKK